MIRHLALVGYPVGHSLSPTLFGTLFRLGGHRGHYSLISASAVPSVRELFSDLSLTAVNVTAPHKCALLAQMDEVTPAALSIGALNVVVQRDGLFVGHNTDLEGVKAVVQSHCAEVADAQFIVLGAGGASAAVIATLVRLGAEVVILNRTASRGAELARRFGVTHVAQCADCSIRPGAFLFSCLPAGASVPALPWHLLRIAFDASYSCSPIEPMAKQHGVRYINGLQWLAHQAIATYNFAFHSRLQISTDDLLRGVGVRIPVRHRSRFDGPPIVGFPRETTLTAWGATQAECQSILKVERLIHQ